MPARRVAANPFVKDNIGKLAIARGPLVYCLEQVDNKSAIGAIAIPPYAKWSESRIAALGGIVALETEGMSSDATSWPGGLYSTAPQIRNTKVRAIPYYAWDNRKAGPMEVWIPTSPSVPPVAGLESRAKVEMSFLSGNSAPLGIKDGAEPKSSDEQPAALAHWWPHKGGAEWVQYTWPAPVNVGSVQVYWFDDTGRGECRIPKSWRLEALVDGKWSPVKATYPIKLNSWCDVSFGTLKTTSLRLQIDMQTGWAAGIHEWRVWAPED